VKKFLKIAFWILLPIMLVAAFYGYHFYRAKALEKMRYSDAEVSAVDAESAVSILIYSMGLDKGIKCEPKGLIEENVNDYLEAGMIADVYKSDTIMDRRIEKEHDDLGRTSIAVYKKKRNIGCYGKVESVILKENADSLFGVTCSLFLDKDMRQGFYVGKRRNGIVTECENYYRYEPSFSMPLNLNSVQRMELDSVSGRITKFISKKGERIPYKIRKLYDWFSYDSFMYDDLLLDAKMIFDSLGRLVKSNMKGKVFRYVHLTNDTANLNVKIYSESGKNIGFYKRSFDYNGNLQTVRYGTNFYEVNEKRYYENGKLIKETSNENRFYFSLRSRVRLFDSMENEILDSSFYEHTFLPGTRFGARSYVVKRKYENGKIKRDERYEKMFRRSLSFMFSPMKSEKIKEIKNLKFEYDQMGTLISMVDILHEKKVLFSKEKQDSLPRCSDDIFRYWGMKKCEKGMENSIQMKPWMPK
jgi:antitoxin component YwqK of YwqJK toxin-antitoxin module